MIYSSTEFAKHFLQNEFEDMTIFNPYIGGNINCVFVEYETEYEALYQVSTLIHKSVSSADSVENIQSKLATTFSQAITNKGVISSFHGLNFQFLY
jgi:hypothetical protein